MQLPFLPPPKLPGGPYIMGVLNVTPDSFSDGGVWRGEGAAAHALAMAEAGADVIDLGGESTRPGAAPVAADEEIARVVPVIEAVRRVSAAPISIDTMKPEVAEAAFAAGATIWNDVMALRAPGALAMAARLKAPVILMHMQGEPRTMQAAPHYDDVVTEVAAFLSERAEAARAAGASVVCVDPGIGFGKTLRHNLALIAALPALAKAAAAPILFGASRKSLIEKIEERASTPAQRLGGSIALALRAAQNGAAMLRVHDVAETAQALTVWRASGMLG